MSAASGMPAFEAPLYLKNGIFKGLLVDICNDIIMCYFQKISRETNKKKNKQWGRLKEHAATRVATTSILGPAFLTLTLLRAPAIENSEILKKMVVFSPPSLPDAISFSNTFCLFPLPFPTKINKAKPVSARSRLLTLTRARLAQVVGWLHGRRIVFPFTWWW